MMMRLTVIALAIVALFFAIGTGPAAAQGAAQPDRAKLMTPALLNETAPKKFQAKFETSRGEFVIEVTRAWAPNGADRFYNLVKNGFYDGCRFFRVVENFMVQFGINGDAKLNAVMGKARIPDDPKNQSNLRAFVTFAMAGPNTRTSQIFINFKDNSFLDEKGFPPFGIVTKGMSVVDAIYSKYGEKPEQARIQGEGNAYLEKAFPNLDYVKSATLVTPAAK
jgi:peptidyl-prolyl cis-trans isomerase A (cyclophilin A)